MQTNLTTNRFGIRQGVTLTGRNRTAGYAPGPAAADHPRPLQTTTDDADRRQRAKQHWPIMRASNNNINNIIGLMFPISHIRISVLRGGITDTYTVVSYVVSNIDTRWIWLRRVRYHVGLGCESVHWSCLQLQPVHLCIIHGVSVRHSSRQHVGRRSASACWHFHGLSAADDVTVTPLNDAQHAT